MPIPTLVLHGGAGNIDLGKLSSSPMQAARAGLLAGLHAGGPVLAAGGTALAAVLHAVRAMEDAPGLNAGHGSVLARNGVVTCDASIMCGRTGRAGAVGMVSRLANPILAADLIRREGPHTLLIGAEAEAMAAAHGQRLVHNNALITDHRRCQLQALLASHAAASLDHDDQEGGTVGAVAIDANGNLAAATSTGGMTGKLAGRVGDSAIPGAGTWVENGVCALSTTGTGDVFLARATARGIADRVKLAGIALAQACLDELQAVQAHGGTGGVIGIDSAGNVAMPFVSTGMFRGVWQGGHSQIAIGPEELHDI